MCNCLNDATCDPYDGKCICKKGFRGRFCEIECSQGVCSESSSFENQHNVTMNHSGPDCGVSSAIVGQISHGDSFPHGLFPW